MTEKRYLVCYEPPKWPSGVPSPSIGSYDTEFEAYSARRNLLKLRLDIIRCWIQDSEQPKFVTVNISLCKAPEPLDAPENFIVGAVVVCTHPTRVPATSRIVVPGETATVMSVNLDARLFVGKLHLGGWQICLSMNKFIVMSDKNS